MEKNIAVLKAPNKNVFVPWGTMEGLGYQAGLYAYDKLGYKTATLVLEDFNAGQDFTGGVAKAFQARGGTIVQTVPVKAGTTDFSPFVTNLKQADAVFYWFTPPLAQRFTAQYIAAGLKMPLFMILAGQLTPPSLAQFGEKAVGIMGCGHYSTLIDSPMNKSYVENAIKKNATNLLQEQSLSGIIAMSMYIEALKATNGDSSPAKIIPALHNVKVTTPQGVCSVTADGLGVGDLYMMKVAKVGENYTWTLLDKSSQVTLDIPTK
jgi:branched-chain amino acid transport system substrate-binding protein